MAEMFFAGLALAGWGWIVLDEAFVRDSKQLATRWIALGFVGAVMLVTGGMFTLIGLVNWLYAHLRIV